MKVFPVNFYQHDSSGILYNEIVYLTSHYFDPRAKNSKKYKKKITVFRNNFINKIFLHHFSTTDHPTHDFQEKLLTFHIFSSLKKYKLLNYKDSII